MSSPNRELTLHIIENSEHNITNVSCIDPIRASMEQDGYTKVCEQCHKIKANKLCKGCKLVRYCNVECQTQNWESHKRQCKEWKQYGLTTDFIE